MRLSIILPLSLLALLFALVAANGEDLQNNPESAPSDRDLDSEPANNSWSMGNVWNAVKTKFHNTINDNIHPQVPVNKVKATFHKVGQAAIQIKQKIFGGGDKTAQDAS